MYDLVIIGGSAAGSAAAVYAARRKLNFVMISDDFGGEMARSGDVWNYPAIPKTNGIELSDMFRDHIKKNGVEPELGVWVQSIVKNGEGDFLITAKKGKEQVTYETKSVIVATGAHPRKLKIPGEKELEGKGVTYCTTCDGPLFKDKKVVTVGGGNSGLESALMLAEIASHVTLVNINDTFNGEQILIDKALAHDKIDVIYNAETTTIEGDPMVERVTYKDKLSGEEKSIDTQGVFVHIGTIPNSELAPEDVTKNKFKEIEINLHSETSVPGIFAAGDVTSVPYKQIAVATGTGVAAALSAISYINKLG